MATLNLIRAFLDGKKSHLGMIAAGLLGILWSSGLVSDETAKVAAFMIATWTGVSFRAAMAKKN